jgi:hypothetical protein
MCSWACKLLGYISRLMSTHDAYPLLAIVALITHCLRPLLPPPMPFIAGPCGSFHLLDWVEREREWESLENEQWERKGVRCKHKAIKMANRRHPCVKGKCEVYCCKLGWLCGWVFLTLNQQTDFFLNHINLQLTCWWVKTDLAFRASQMGWVVWFFELP